LEDPNTPPRSAGDRAASSPGFLRGLSFLAAVALIVGNMVGTSIYTLPASLAKEVGPLGLLAWALTAIGYAFVAIVYARLGLRSTRTGGPYIYVREAFGEFAAFQTVWSYWLSAVLGNAAIALAVVGYTSKLWPQFDASAPAQFLMAQVMVWGLTATNVLGVRGSGRFQVAVVICNLVPLVVLSIWALAAFDVHNLEPFAPQGWSALPLGMAMIVWAYSGIESATVPAEEIQAGSGTISRATLTGYGLATIVFLLSALAVAGSVDNATLASNARPMALAMQGAIGPWAAGVISVTAVIAGLGTLNGWILMAGRIPVSAAADGLFFRGFARLHPRRHTPHVSLLVAGAVSSALLFKLFASSLLELFDFILLLSVLTTLLPHLYAMAAQISFARRAWLAGAGRRRDVWIAGIAFAFVLFTIYGCGSVNIAWGMLAVLAGVPLYVVFQTRRAP
jgi:APA family basic amino acid/polyamine antiporter